MRTLSEEGEKLVDQVADRHGVGRDAVVALLQALDRGNGVQAQFSHPDLGGLGQWSRGGMIMVGDMFNNGLKARIDALCSELSELMHGRAMFKPLPRGEAASSASWSSASYASGWWPEECGIPSATGGQNDMRYACFPDTRRVAIQHGGTVRVYDSGEHRITGVSQQQSGGQDLTFTSQHGPVRLRELTPFSEERAPEPPVHAASAELHPAPPAEAFARTPATPPPATPSFADHDVFAKIERLHELAQRGVLSEAEFAEKKKELLARI